MEKALGYYQRYNPADTDVDKHFLRVVHSTHSTVKVGWSTKLISHSLSCSLATLSLSETATLPFPITVEMGDASGFDPCACVNSASNMMNRLLQMVFF